MRWLLTVAFPFSGPRCLNVSTGYNTAPRTSKSQLYGPPDARRRPSLIYQWSSMYRGSNALRGDGCWICALSAFVTVTIGRPELALTNGLTRRPFPHDQSRCRRIALLTPRSLNGVVSLECSTQIATMKFFSRCQNCGAQPAVEYLQQCVTNVQHT
jgi:hypothetical protein